MQRARSGTICRAAENGLIQGSMDFGLSSSLGWVNHWAFCGLREAAYAAHELGLPDEAGALQAEAEDLKLAIRH